MAASLISGIIAQSLEVSTLKPSLNSHLFIPTLCHGSKFGLKNVLIHSLPPKTNDLISTASLSSKWGGFRSKRWG